MMRKYAYYYVEKGVVDSEDGKTTRSGIIYFWVKLQQLLLKPDCFYKRLQYFEERDTGDRRCGAPNHIHTSACRLELLREVSFFLVPVDPAETRLTTNTTSCKHYAVQILYDHVWLSRKSSRVPLKRKSLNAPLLDLREDFKRH